ncbi:MAG: M60 family metallopeptidase [Alloprevotella sp.]|nr:M60 family metallopeptidase [Alloprevotella sp.]
MKRILFSLLTLLLAFAGTTPSFADDGLTGEELVKSYLANGGLFRIYGTRNNYTNRCIVENSSHQLVVQAKNNSRVNLSEIWSIEKSGNAYILRNANSGRYVQNQTAESTPHETGVGTARFYIKYSENNAEGGEYVTISNKSNYSGNVCFHQDASNKVVIWAASESASNWRLEPVTDVTEEDIKAHFNADYNYTNQLTAGNYYRIRSNAYPERAIMENVSDNTLKGAARDESNLYQVWKLVGSLTAAYFENAVTGHRIARNSDATSTKYKTTAAGGTFRIASKGDKWVWTYTIADGGATSYGLHCAETQSYNIVKWSTDADASVWGFEAVEPDADALAAAQAEFASFSDMQSNASQYTTQLANFFTTSACAELKDEYKNVTDDALRTAMGELPEPIKAMAVKVKNNAWTTYDGWDKTERNFRIDDHKAYSDFSKWTSIIGMGYNFGRLTNPTGIRVNEGDQLQVYVGDIPSGQSIALEIVGETQAAGSVTSLKKGFNVVKAGAEGHVFVFYNVDNTKTSTYTDIDSYAPVTVHVEGGTVCGYFDQTKGDDNDDWAQLQKHLFNGSTVVLKTNHHLFNLNRERALTACPTNVTGLLDIWSGIAQMEDETMGLYEDFGGKFNNLWSVTSINTNYMYASTYGTYYENSTLSSVFNYNNMHTSAGSIWGPAHEQGHNRQKLINMIGCTEVSNNVFSNIAVYRQGRATSRATSIKTTLNEFNSGIAWLDRLHDNSLSSGQADLWQCTHLYWQLYQFFHIQGFKPDFYPELFRAMRKSPMTHSANTFVTATNDYLKFYTTCCQVSGYDLTEFFAGYGFFMIPELTSHTVNGTTKNAHYLSDYGDYYITVNQTEINNAIRKVKNMNLKPCNAIFIEDRITAPAATYEGASSSAKKVAFSDEYPIGTSSNGQYGQYTDFVAEDQIKDGDFTYTINASRRVTITNGGSGKPVGFKVYDKEDNLVALYNTRTFQLPQTIVDAGFVIKVAAGNGNDHVVWDANDTGINLITPQPAGSQATYDLQGRRIQSPQRGGGIYIQNGRKVIF